MNSDEQKHIEEEHEGKTVEEENVEDILHLQKKRGFKRVGPHVQSEPILKEKDFQCEICGSKFESKSLVDAHSKSHIPKSVKTGYNCDEKYNAENDKGNHKDEEHKGKINSRQFNCLDCAFQEEKSLDLRKHVLRTQHTPCEYKEECYNCRKQFDNYFHLMNHRREEHKSNKPCRYFLENRCIYEAKKCWYMHKEKTQMTHELMIDGNVNEEGQDSVFYNAINKNPPDQMNLLSEIIKQMTIQMKNLQTITKGS